MSDKEKLNKEAQEKREVKWYRSKTTADVLSGVSIACFVLSSLSNFLGKYPFLQFIFIPAQGFFRAMAFGLWRAAIAFDPEIDLIDKDKFYYLDYSNWFYKGAAYSGFLSGVAMVVAFAFPATAPIALAISTGALFVSNICWTAGEISELMKIIRTESEGDHKKFLVGSQVSRVIYAGSGNVSLALFAASLLVSAAFPPVGAALLVASTVCAIVGVVGLVASVVLNKIGEKKKNKGSVDTKKDDIESAIVDSNTNGLENDPKLGRKLANENEHAQEMQVKVKVKEVDSTKQNNVDSVKEDKKRKLPQEAEKNFFTPSLKRIKTTNDTHEPPKIDRSKPSSKSK